MKRIVRLTESDLTRIIRQVINEAHIDIPQNEILKAGVLLDMINSNIEKYKSDSQITVFDCDLFEVPTNMLSNVIQLFFYDGPHDEKTTAEAVQYYWSCLQNEAIMVFDDANWEGVVAGANKGIEAMNGQITYKKLMLNTEENANEWWNGLYIVIVRKT